MVFWGRITDKKWGQNFIPDPCLPGKPWAVVIGIVPQGGSSTPKGDLRQTIPINLEFHSTS